MKATLLVSSALVASAYAYDFTQWTPAGADDVRSPCPMLNALANHNFLPHSGRGLTVPLLQDVLKDVLNIGKDLTTILAVGGVLQSQNPLGLSFNLDDLNAHNGIEHDGSLGHNDFNLGGDDHTFNQTLFDTYLAYYDGVNMTSLERAAKGRWMRIQTESQRDPEFTYGPKQFIISYGETALILSVLGDPSNGVVPVDWLKVVWEQERLPYNEGWRTTDKIINGLTVNLMIPKLVKASGEGIPEGLLLTTNTLARGLAGLDPMNMLSALESTVLGLFGLSL